MQSVISGGGLSLASSTFSPNDFGEEQLMVGVSPAVTSLACIAGFKYVPSKRFWFDPRGGTRNSTRKRGGLPPLPPQK